MTTALALPPAVTETTLGTRGLRGWRISTPACQALVSAQGAQVLAFQARGQAPLLWLSPQALFQPGKAIRGGIPLCFPWFGPHPDDPARPAHGFARLRDWRLVEASATGEALQLELALDDDEATRALWSHAFSARLRLTFGRSLALRLTVTNTGQGDFPLGFAFHSYFPLADSAAAHVEGLDGSLYIDQVAAGRPRRHQDGLLRFSGETDRIYLFTSGCCRLVDEVNDHVVRLAAPECRSVIAWNPGPDKSARLADMGPGAWRGMACVESGNVEDDAVRLLPGAARAFTLVLEQ